jgi:hypothetical protein
MLQSPWHTSVAFQPFLAMPASGALKPPVVGLAAQPAYLSVPLTSPPTKDSFTSASTSSGLQTATLPASAVSTLLETAPQAAHSALKQWAKGAAIIASGFGFGFAGKIKGIELVILAAATATTGFILHNGLQTKQKLQQPRLL